jgi:hypothetical protein
MAYRTPRRLNAVSVTLLLGAIAGVYWLYVFFPIYWDGWTVDHELREAAAACYQINRYAEPARTEELRKLLKKTRETTIGLAHITDPAFDVELEIEGDDAVLIAKYDVVVKHPFGNYKSVVHMKRSQHANIKQVKWE